MADSPADMRYPLERQKDYDAWISFNTNENPVAATQSRLNTDDQEQQDIATVKNEGILIPNPESVHLYLPGSLTYPGSVNYENAALGARGAIALEAINKGKGVLGTAKSLVGDAITSTTDLIKAGSISNAAENPAIQNVIAKVISRDFFAQDLQDAAQAGLKITDNPNFRTLFRDVPIRVFNFQFDMRPESSKELTEIKNIIRFFRRELYPTRIPSPEGVQSTFGYNFPRTFNIHAWYKDPSNRLGHRFKPAYLTDFNVVYNPESMAFFHDGEFTTYQISLQFTEIRALTSEDIDEDY